MATTTRVSSGRLAISSEFNMSFQSGWVQGPTDKCEAASYRHWVLLAIAPPGRNCRVEGETDPKGIGGQVDGVGGAGVVLPPGAWKHRRFRARTETGKALALSVRSSFVF